MGHGDRAAGERDALSAWIKFIEWTAPVDIAGDCCDGSDRSELIDNRSVPDVTRVQDLFDATKMLPDRRVEATMCVGNNADPHAVLQAKNVPCA